MAVQLKVEARSETGKRNAKRARLAGKIPAILYGHKKDNVSLYVGTDDFSAVVRHGSHVVQLVGAVSEKAFVKALQWDTFGKDVLHIDFTRVSEHEKVKLVVPVELRGDAEGLKQGGIVRLHVHELEVECEAEAIPEKISIKVNSLKLDDMLKVSDLVLPAGVIVLAEPEELLVDCVIPVEVEETDATTAAAEPEVIGRKKEEDEEDAK